ncbi:hypothetical protein PIIN_11133 [Serendipita indica DSM 11827]|uniref:Uncharacterized protein n=1 Tax=Serendipita indica (strain DSM 11827) TaxID=1109443 RepID=G4U0Q7_SERID|nr:hypothetical protein PIIN_11133 [Serendipita indica DSM 11827]
MSGAAHHQTRYNYYSAQAWFHMDRHQHHQNQADWHASQIPRWP